VRSVHAQNRAASRAEAGQRCALAVAGLAKDEVQRGQWLVSPEVALATDRIDIQVRAWRELERPVRSGARVHLHAGATRTEATVTLLDTAALAPGETACAQLTLPTPIGAWRGDRVVLRDAVSGLPLAGGRVLDPWAPRRYRRAPSRLAGLAALQTEPASQRLDGLVSSSPQGLNLSRWARAEGRLDDPLTLMPRDALPARDDGDTSVLAGTFARALEAAAVEALRRHHAAAPDEIGLDAGRLRVMVAPRLGAALWDALLRSWQQAGQMRRRGTFMQLPEHGSRLSTVEQKLAERLLARLLAAGPRGVKLPELLNEASSATQIRITLSHMARNGSAHQVAKDLYYPAVTLHELAGAAQEVARVHAGDITAAHFRDAIHVARRRAILVLEYFDRVGLTRRVGDVHRLQGDIQCFASDH
jgi:selenocysteine-specific elongation factor